MLIMRAQVSAVHLHMSVGYPMSAVLIIVAETRGGSEGYDDSAPPRTMRQRLRLFDNCLSRLGFGQQVDAGLGVRRNGRRVAPTGRWLRCVPLKVGLDTQPSSSDSIVTSRAASRHNSAGVRRWPFSSKM